MPKKIDEIGNKYGRLTVISEAGRDSEHCVTWLCRCDCGESVVVRGSHLRGGDVKSCGRHSPEFVNEVGNRYGRLVVLEEAGRNKHRSVLWRCQCDCGNIVTVVGKDLRKGVTKSCGCLGKNCAFINETGNRYGRLTVIERAGIYAGGGIMWLCKCDCGNTSAVRGSGLRNGSVQSCGCLQKELTRKRRCLPDGQAGLNKICGAYKRSARDKGISFELTKDEFKKINQQPCFYCGSDPVQTVKVSGGGSVYTYNGIDRIDNDKGYTLDNVVPCCGLCNRTKGALSVDGFLEHIKRIYNYSILGSGSEKRQDSV